MDNPVIAEWVGQLEVLARNIRQIRSELGDDHREALATGTDELRDALGSKQEWERRDVAGRFPAEGEV
jgi:hypothetical protein